MVNKLNPTKKYSLEWRTNTWRQGARRQAGAVILSSNPHLTCMLGQKTLCQAIERVSGKSLKVWWGLWNVLQLGRLDLHNFSLLIDFTLCSSVCMLYVLSPCNLLGFSLANTGDMISFQTQKTSSLTFFLDMVSIGASIHIGPEIQCLPYVVLLIITLDSQSVIFQFICTLFGEYSMTWFIYN